METKVMNCIMCPMGCELTVTMEHGKFVSVTGNTCPRGAKYAEQEVTDPKRMLTTTVRIQGALLPLLPVVSADVLPKGKVADCIRFLRQVEVEAPVQAGQVVVPDILGLGVDIVASRAMEKVVP
ncbi:MAG: DUF1667 domain-containing protein [Acidaminococcaceae bacterium]|jgi:CxxC motif-containing protein|nr:DUF1667 domain-containing protein [Acidaminococcaceae bacterium]HAY61277.1 molybdopterin oxidoreductase [Acidaminococcaceae bacterium]